MTKLEAKKMLCNAVLHLYESRGLKHPNHGDEALKQATDGLLNIALTLDAEIRYGRDFPVENDLTRMRETL